MNLEIKHFWNFFFKIIEYFENSSKIVKIASFSEFFGTI